MTGIPVLHEGNSEVRYLGGINPVAAGGFYHLHNILRINTFINAVVPKSSIDPAEVSRIQDRNTELEAKLRVPGDMNGDGSADVRDSQEICMRLAGGKEVPFVADADLNKDGKIDVADAMLIAKRFAGN